MNARFKITVARKHRRTDQVVLDDRLFNGIGQRPGIAYACRAAVACEVEAEFFKVRQQPRFTEILGDHTRSRRERRLDVFLHAKAVFDRFLCKQARCQQHAGVGGIGARRNRGDDDVARADVDAIAGLEAPFQVFVLLGKAVFSHRLGEQFGEPGFYGSNLDAILWALGSGKRRRDCRQIQLQYLAIVDLALPGDTEQALRLEVRSERFDFPGRAARTLEVLDSGVIDRKETHGGAVLRRHIGDRGAVGQRQVFHALAEELDKLAHYLGSAKHFSDGQDQISCGDAAAQRALEVHADHVGREEIDWLTEHACLGLDAAHTPANHADAVDHRGVAVGPDQSVGIIDAVLSVNAARQVFEIHLVHDTYTRWYDFERVESLHAPFHELVALLVPLEFQFHVEVERFLAAVVVHLHRVVHHQVHRHQRFDHLRIPAHPAGYAAHRGQVRQQRHASEVLEHDARHHERDLLGAGRVWLPAGQLPDMLFGHFFAVDVAQHRFEHDADGNRQP